MENFSKAAKEYEASSLSEKIRFLQKYTVFENEIRKHEVIINGIVKKGQVSQSIFCWSSLRHYLGTILKGSFRLQQFCCDQKLMQYVAINWKFFNFYCNTQSVLVTNCSRITVV